MADEDDVPGVHRRVGFEIIEDAAGGPGPRADGAPCVRGGCGLARRQGQADDPGLIGAGGISLHLGVTERGVTIAAGEDVGNGSDFAEATQPVGRVGGRIAEEKQMQQDGHPPGRLGRQIEVNMHGRPVRFVAEMSDDLLAHSRAVHRAGIRLDDRERHRGRAFRHAAIDLGFVKPEQFRAALFEPGVGVAHGLAVLQDEWIGQRVGADPGFVVIGNVSGRSAAERVAVGVGARQGGGSGCGFGGADGQAGENQQTEDGGDTKARDRGVHDKMVPLISARRGRWTGG